MKKSLLFILLLVLLVLGFLLRSKMFLHGDFYYLSDQGRDMELIKSIAFDHKFTLIGGHAGIGGLFHGPLWWYLLSFVAVFSGGNPFWTLIPVYELISIGLIVVGYIVASKLYGRVTGFFVAFLLTFSHTFIDTVQFTSNSQVMPLVFLGYFFSIRMFMRGKDAYILFALLFIGLGIHFESAFAVMLIPITFFAFLYSKRLPNIRYLLGGSILFFLSISNFILFDLRHQYLMTHSVLRILSGHVKASGGDTAYAHLLYRLQDRFAWVLTTFKTTLYIESNLMILFLLCLLLGGIVVFYLLWRNHREDVIVHEAMFLLAVIIIAFVGYYLYPLSLQAHYIQSLAIAAIFFTALCMRQLFSYRIGQLLVLLFTGTTIFLSLHTLVQEYIIDRSYTATTEGSYKNQLAAVDFVYKDAKHKPFGYFVYDAPIVTYGIDYLMWWRGKTAYHYVAESKKLPMTYLIMLPAPYGDLHAHDFWKHTMVKTQGKVLSQNILSGNIIIQKLAIDPSEGPANPNYYQNLIFR